MNNVLLLVIIILMWIIPVFVVYNKNGTSVAMCILGTVVITVLCIICVFISYGSDGIKYIWMADNLVEMWSRFMEALISIRNWESFPPR